MSFQGMRGLLLCLVLLALSASACANYQTIGAGPGDFQLPTSSSSSKTLPTPTKPKARPAILSTATLDATVYCRLSDLTPAATASPEGDALSGSLTLTNYWDVPCTLKGQPALGLTDDGGMDFNLVVTQPTPASNPARWLFKPGAVAELRFTWLNWCVKIHGALRVSVTMPGQGEAALYVPVRAPSGNVLSANPTCKNDKDRSTLTIGKFLFIK